MSDLIIGDTPSQLGQISAANAIIVDGNVVTRDDYIALRDAVYPYGCRADWFDFEKGSALSRPPVGSIVSVYGKSVKVIAHELTSYSVFDNVIAVVFSSRDDNGLISLGFETNIVNIKPVDFEGVDKLPLNNELSDFYGISADESCKALMKTNIKFY